MESLIGLLLIIAVCAKCITGILRLCRDNPSIRPWSSFLILCFVFWALVTAHRATFWLSQSDGTEYDGFRHDYLGRQIAEQLSSGEINIYNLQLLSNDGYRSLLGVFYFVTNAPQEAGFAIHAMLAFFGLLFTLESCAIVANVRKLPFWLVAYTMLLPSALIFTPWLLKEGPALWSIGLLLRFGVSTSAESLDWRKLTHSVVAAIVLFTLRPHVAFAWLTAIAVSRFFSFKNPRIAFAAGIGSILVFIVTAYASDYIAPGFIAKVGESGLVATLDKMTDIAQGGSAIYRTSTPIPFLNGLIFVFLEPNPLYWSSINYAVVGAEVWAITIAICYSWFSSRGNLTSNINRNLLLCAVAILALSFYLGYMYNMGLMVRQRLQAMPALILLAAIPLRDPVLRDVIPRFKLPA